MRTVSQSPIAAAEQDAGAENRANRSRVGALHKALDIWVGAISGEQRGGDQDQNEGRQKDAYGRDHRAPESGHEVADKGGGNNDRTGADHPDRNRNQELPLIQPAILRHQPLLKERNDHQATAEGQ